MVYASLCKVLSPIKVELLGTNGKCTNFRRALLTRVQQDFEKFGEIKELVSAIKLAQVMHAITIFRLYMLFIYS